MSIGGFIVDPTSKRYNTPARDTLHLPEGEVITNAMYPVRGCFQHIRAIMSGRIKGTRPLRMRSSIIASWQRKWRRKKRVIRKI